MSKAVITNDIDKFLENVRGEIIRRDELKIEDVREIEKIAYIKEKNKKNIFIAAEKFNVYAQNALLKLIEEPPKNVEITLVTTSKYSLLDTILSRVQLEKIFFDIDDEYELKPITNEYILELLTKDIEKEEIKRLLKSILKNKNLDEESLKIINDAYIMLELNLDKEYILYLVMLSLKVKNANL